MPRPARSCYNCHCYSVCSIEDGLKESFKVLAMLSSITNPDRDINEELRKEVAKRCYKYTRSKE